ncbi:MAG: UbiD family decarboxylase [Planctomycetota bacterium]|jgi:4-hydroxy-3-polyprenylbenzoate decarboxylase
MPYYCLADFLEELAQAGELARVETGVNPVLEAAEITARIARSTGKALLFGAIEGHPLPLLTNLLGTEARICRAAGVRSIGELAERVAEAIEPSGSEGWLGRVSAASGGVVGKSWEPKRVKTGACQQIVRLGDDVDLGRLPALQCSANETGRTVTAGQLLTAEADTGRQSCGRYELPVLDRTRLAVAWHDHDEPAGLLLGYRERGARMPVAVILGGDPAGLMAAMAPLPPSADALAVAGLLRQKALELVECRTVELSAPADAEMIIEGYVDPAEPPVRTGPLAASGGFCQRSGAAQVMHVTAVTHRANPVFPAFVPGRLPDEICTIRRAMARAFSPVVKGVIPELVDYDLPVFGAARQAAFVSIRKRYAGEARKVAHAVWGLRPWMFVKLLVIVDEEVDVRDERQVWSAVASHADPGRDVLFASGPPDPLDPAGSPDGLSRPVAVDATRKLPGERSEGPAEPVDIPAEVRRAVTNRWSEYGLGPDPS